MKAGAHMVRRAPVPATPLPLVEFHTATIHHIGVTVHAQAPTREAEADPKWFRWMWAAAVVAGCLASAVWKTGFAP